VLGVIAAALLLLVALALLVNADARFVARAGYEEVRLLLRRRPLEELIGSSAIPEARKARFSLVLAARAFGADTLNLKVGKTYTTFVDVGRDTLVLVLSASPRFRLEEYTWRFPVVGSVPYHGYFSLDAANAETRRMEAKGYDTYLRPAGAFSTLGWFGDPLFSTALSRDSSQLVETVVHEVTHNTLWVPGSVAFNESLAMFVGFRGAERFFRSRGDVALAQRTAAAWEDEKRLGHFYRDLAATLDSLYRSNADSVSMSVGRDVIFARAKETLGGPMRGVITTYPIDWLLSQPLNNATVVAARVYRTKLGLFDRVLQANGGDVRLATRAIIDAVQAKRGIDPYLTVAALADTAKLSRR
jgi:predicted aminopeptidase